MQAKTSSREAVVRGARPAPEADQPGVDVGHRPEDRSRDAPLLA